MENKPQFSFAISLSILNHLGRNLYRNFITVLGEAISNSWDADATNVHIVIDKEANCFSIRDDGHGMSHDDFQNKLLKIGYSKRKDGQMKSKNGRPFIGRKGIGKLALLSCAEKISILSKTKSGTYVGGIIDNSALTKAITDDLVAAEYKLGAVGKEKIHALTTDHEHGTIISFDGMRDGIFHSIDYLKRGVAYYFRFSLLDPTFKIHINGEEITIKHLEDLAKETQFLWRINNDNDPYVELLKPHILNNKDLADPEWGYSGFIASVKRPRDMKVMGTDERIGIDLFVNGRVREKNILRYIQTNRVAESYLYGQVHVNSLDSADTDRFTSSREGIIADDESYKKFLESFRDNILQRVIEDWDALRIKNREDGDSENTKIPKRERKSQELFNAVSEDYLPARSKKNKTGIDAWVDELAMDARFNLSSYAECFISENLARKFIQAKKLPLSDGANKEIVKYKQIEEQSKKRGNISIEIREGKTDLSYVTMDEFAWTIDGAETKGELLKEASLIRDASEFKPIRDALAHTARLTDLAKTRFTSTYENIKGRLRKLFLENTDSNTEI